MRRKRSFTVKKWKNFFMDDELHRILKRNIAADEVVAWNFPQHKVVVYPLSIVKRYGAPALTSRQVADILNRHPVTLRKLRQKGQTPFAHMSYSIEKGTPGRLYWQKKDVLEMLQSLAENPRGRPRKDKRAPIGAGNLPSPGEVKARLNHGIELYAKNQEGKLVRLWEADRVEW